MHAALTPPATIGFVGLGNMGYPMAVNLAKAGFKLAVADLNQDGWVDLRDMQAYVEGGGAPGPQPVQGASSTFSNTADW